MSIFNEARQQIWEELKGLSDEEFNRKPAADEWSVREVLDHLKKLTKQRRPFYQSRQKTHR